ncbi:hypothetical protein [Nocardioides sp. HB32]
MTREYDQLRNDPALLEGLGGGGAAEPDGDVVLGNGKVLSCLVCGGVRFARREVKMNTTGMSFMDLDWANRSGDGAICQSCGFVHTFLDGNLTWRR